MLSIGTKLHTPYLEEAISSAGREETKEILIKKHNPGYGNLIVIDGQEFTSVVKNITDSQLQESEKVLLLPAGIDAAIIETTKKAELALPVGDCGALIAYLKDPNNSTKVIASAHVGYKGVIAGMIENFILELLKVGNTNNINDFTFHLSPMAGKNFELPLDFFHTNIGKYILSKGLEPNNYISLSYNNRNTIRSDYGIDNTYISNAQYKKLILKKDIKIYFDLQALILDILQKNHGIIIPLRNQARDTTTNPKNILSSFRNYSHANRIFQDEKLLASLGLDNNDSYINKIIRKEKAKSSYNPQRMNFTPETIDLVKRIYDINFEQAELLLYETYHYYKSKNSRLSLNVFTYEAENEE